MEILVRSIAVVVFVAGHREPFGEDFHTHAWKVTATFRCPEDPVDGRLRQNRMLGIVNRLGHDLNLEMGRNATNEGLAVRFLQGLYEHGAIKVEVSRDLEGLGAVAELTP